eukprot:Colp12_sorted_trinity150504_noHs@6516
MHVSKILFLPLKAGRNIDKLQVKHIMASPVLCITRQTRLSKIRKLLACCTHNGFPVVEEGPREVNGAHKRRLVGLISRQELYQILTHVDEFGLLGAFTETVSTCYLLHTHIHTCYLVHTQTCVFGFFFRFIY